MNNQKNKNKSLEAAMICGITLLFVIPFSMLGSATDTTPPTIYNIQIQSPIPLYQMQGPLDFAVEFYVDDGPSGSGVQEARIILNGPGGFAINETAEEYYGDYFYEYIADNPMVGTYSFYIRAVDNAGNVAVSSVFHFLILNPLPTAYVDASNVNGPWEGNQRHPFDNIAIAMFAVTSGGTIRIVNGVYHESTIVTKPVTIIGQNRSAVIIDGTDIEHSPFIFNSDLVVISYLTIRNWGSPLLLNRTITLIDCDLNNFSTHAIGFGYGTNSVLINRCAIYNNHFGININSGDNGVLKNKVITNNDIYDNMVGIYIYGSLLLNNNTIHHNNIFDNEVNFQVGSGQTLGANAWDDGSIGNYWGDYRQRYPNADVVPSTGTWDTPYNMYPTMNNDHHPWVYPNGFIDSVPPVITVTSPNGGENLSGQNTVIWTATDDLISNLSVGISIFYSADAGATWHTIVQHLNNSGSYVWDTNTVADGIQYLIKINASDEFQNIGSDISDNVFTIFNHPNQTPNTPQQPTGPTSGYIGTEYTYTSSTTDPNNDPMYYKWSWGTGESDWMGPYASGVTISASHTWTTAGTYDVKVKAKDTSDVESDWSEKVSVVISEVPEQPVLSIDTIAGGFGITAVIKNNGTVDATNVSWSIVLDGGFIIHGSNVTGVIDNIPAGGEATISSGLILGLGRTTIVVSATCDEGASAEKTASGFVLLFFVLGVK
jgi:hypothetical protein